MQMMETSKKEISQKAAFQIVLMTFRFFFPLHSCPEAGDGVGQWGHGAESLHEFGAASGDPAHHGERQRRDSPSAHHQHRRGEGDPGPQPGPHDAERRVRGAAAQPQQQRSGPEGAGRLRGCL